MGWKKGKTLGRERETEATANAASCFSASIPKLSSFSLTLSVCGFDGLLPLSPLFIYIFFLVTLHITYID